MEQLVKNNIVDSDLTDNCQSDILCPILAVKEWGKNSTTLNRLDKCFF